MQRDTPQPGQPGATQIGVVLAKQQALPTGQRFFGGFEALHALRRGHAQLNALVPRYEPLLATLHERVRTVARAVTALGAHLTKVAAPAA